MESHLLQMRGLKLKFKRFFGVKAGSHLLQMRGLKPITVCHLRVMFGRIFYRCVD